jgi:hypothetical protein
MYSHSRFTALDTRLDTGVAGITGRRGLQVAESTRRGARGARSVALMWYQGLGMAWLTFIIVSQGSMALGGIGSPLPTRWRLFMKLFMALNSGSSRASAYNSLRSIVLGRNGGCLVVGHRVLMVRIVFTYSCWLFFVAAEFGVFMMILDGCCLLIRLVSGSRLLIVSVMLMDSCFRSDTGTNSSPSPNCSVSFAMLLANCCVWNHVLLVSNLRGSASVLWISSFSSQNPVIGTGARVFAGAGACVIEELIDFSMAGVAASISYGDSKDVGGKREAHRMLLSLSMVDHR